MICKERYSKAGTCSSSMQDWKWEIIKISFLADTDVHLCDITSEDLTIISAFSSLATVTVNKKIKILVTDLMAELLRVLETGNEYGVIFILGPPGTGKTTSLYWLYKQCQGLPQFHPIAIPLHRLGDMHGDVLTLISNKEENQQLVFLIDLSSPRIYLWITASCSGILLQ